MVTKFITVAKVTKGGWVEGERGDRLPLEAAMLLGLSHPGLHLVLSLVALQPLPPGIVSVLDVFQTPQFVQLVMEKQGDMDLFEFIDRNPVMDEILSCLIFRQVAGREYDSDDSRNSSSIAVTCQTSAGGLRPGLLTHPQHPSQGR